MLLQFIFDFKDSTFSMITFLLMMAFKRFNKDKSPRVTPPKKGKRPGPGCFHVPKGYLNDPMQKETEKINQNKLLNSSLFLIFNAMSLISTRVIIFPNIPIKLDKKMIFICLFQGQAALWSYDRGHLPPQSIGQNPQSLNIGSCSQNWPVSSCIPLIELPLHKHLLKL